MHRWHLTLSHQLSFPDPARHILALARLDAKADWRVCLWYTNLVASEIALDVRAPLLWRAISLISSYGATPHRHARVRRAACQWSGRPPMAQGRERAECGDETLVVGECGSVISLLRKRLTTCSLGCRAERHFTSCPAAIAPRRLCFGVVEARQTPQASLG